MRVVASSNITFGALIDTVGGDESYIYALSDNRVYKNMRHVSLSDVNIPGDAVFWFAQTFTDETGSVIVYDMGAT